MGKRDYYDRRTVAVKIIFCTIEMMYTKHFLIKYKKKFDGKRIARIVWHVMQTISQKEILKRESQLALNMSIKHSTHHASVTFQLKSMCE